MRALRLLRDHPRVLAFGASCRLVGGVGQTFFISLFVPEWSAALGLERTGISSLYASATLAAGFALPIIGRGVDRIPLKAFASLVGLGLAAACAGISFAHHITALGVGLFALRLTGQGLMAHTSTTSMARFFVQSRGTALSISFLGHPLAEATLPTLAALGVAAYGWRNLWLFAAAAALGFIALTLLLLAGRDTSPDAFAAGEEIEVSGGEPAPEGFPWTRGDIARDARFWVLLPFWIAPAFVLTGMFFHQLALAEEKGWTKVFLASTFVGFAASQTITSFVSGPLVDRIGPGRILPLHLLPFGVGLCLVGVTDAGPAAWAYMILAGVSIGLAVTARTPWLVSVVGTPNLGGIRSLLIAVAVVSTSASPPAFSLLMDAGFTLSQLALGCGAGVLVVSATGTLAMRALDRDPRPRRAE
jgi:sugar phosphate permease